MPLPGFPGPPHVPGETPRPDPRAFARFKAGLRPGLDASALRESPAWEGARRFYSEGWFWEAHELAEALWAAAPPNAAVRRELQAFVQLANAWLKLRMNRPRAALRLADMVERSLATDREMGTCLGLTPGWFLTEAARVRENAHRAGP